MVYHLGKARSRGMEVHRHCCSEADPSLAAVAVVTLALLPHHHHHHLRLRVPYQEQRQYVVASAGIPSRLLEVDSSYVDPYQEAADDLACSRRIPQIHPVPVLQANPRRSSADGDRCTASLT